jgi:secreted PhoX family phosphatase
VETILRGLTSTDPIRVTPWGTIVAAEEASDGGFYEIINPLNTTNVTVTDRATGAVSGTDATNVVKRTALPKIAWEGIVILPNGVLYAGDELRPGTGTADKDGGSIFKFIPTTLRTSTTPIADLSESPFVLGANYAARVSCTTGVQYGQGCEVGNAEWVPVSAANARNDADAGGATGYYRPEDMDQDSGYDGPGVRGCWANTWDEDAKSYGEILCFIDMSPETAVAGVVSQTRVYRLLEGTPEFNQPDNIHFQPISHAPFVIEDHPNGEIRTCLPDGADTDERSDGCAVAACVKDDSAEPTGWFFSEPNEKGEMAAYVSIQHSNDDNMPLVDDYATDDIIKITGIKVKPPKD